MGIGTALGVALDNMGVGIALGLAVGAAIGVSMSQATDTTPSIDGKQKRLLIILTVLGMLAPGALLVVVLLRQSQPSRGFGSCRTIQMNELYVSRAIQRAAAAAQ